ncbi:2-amino-4-hydroxy-6-hydroxymethyldihydropteridine diphosphokinase [bacterium]
MKNKKIFLSLGSSQGTKIRYVNSAIALLKKHNDIKFIKKSSYYLTEPVDIESTGCFINNVIEIETNLDEIELLRITQEIEKELGRTAKEKNMPRVIDIDIIAFGDRILETQNLTLPHPRMHKRLFVLDPLMQIKPGWKHPKLGKKISALKKEIKTNEKVIKLQTWSEFDE